MPMQSAQDTHSRIVFWLKVMLPLTALAILSTLFLLSRNIGPDGLLPFSEVDVEELAREQRLTSPEFAGVTNDGASVTVRARTARPDLGGTGGSMENVEAEFVGKDGMTVKLRADAGKIDTATGVFVLTDAVKAETSTGYVLNTDELSGKLDRTEITSPGPVDGSAPFGTLNAGAMTLSRTAPDGSDDSIVFTGGVRLIYDPKS